MKCPKCGNEITQVDFLGDAYYGGYAVNETHRFAFTCPDCGEEIFFIQFNVASQQAVATLSEQNTKENKQP